MKHPRLQIPGMFSITIIALLAPLCKVFAEEIILLDPRFGEFSTILDHVVAIESQDLLGFSAWVIDPPFAGFMAGLSVTSGSMEFTAGPFGSFLPVLLPVNPIAQDSVSFRRDPLTGIANLHCSNRNPNHSSPLDLRYRFNVGADTGDPLIHRYTRSGWANYNRDKIGPTHALWLGRGISTPVIGDLGIGIAAGERRYVTTTPDNRQFRQVSSPLEMNTWNQQRWVSLALTHSNARLNMGYSAFQGWEYWQMLGFELPAEGEIMAAGVQMNTPVSKRLQSITSFRWNAFVAEHYEIKGIAYGYHERNEAGLNQQFQYCVSKRLSLMFNSSLHRQEISGSNPPEPFPGSDVITDDRQLRGSLGISALVTSNSIASTGNPLLSIKPSIGYIGSRGGGISGGIDLTKISSSGKSSFSLSLNSYVRPVDLIERWFSLNGVQQNGTPFQVSGNPDLKGERLHSGILHFRSDASDWNYSINLEMSRVEDKIHPIRFNYGNLIGGVPVSSATWITDGHQDDATLIVLLTKKPFPIIGHRLEYQYHQSWNGVDAGIPDHRAIVETEARFSTGLRAIVTWQGYSETYWNDVVPIPLAILPPQGIWSVALCQTAFHHQVEGIISVWNLWDHQFRSHPLGPIRPRRLELSIRVTFGFQKTQSS